MYHIKLTRANRYLGSNFLAASTLSYIKAKPVDFPPPKSLRKPNVITVFASETLYSYKMRVRYSRIMCYNLQYPPQQSFLAIHSLGR